MPHFKIREARSGDEQGIHEAHMRSIREVCSKHHSEIEIRGWGNRPLGNRWIEAIKAGHVWVVESNNGIYGHGYIGITNEHDKKLGHVYGLYLTPEALGKGLGKELWNLMLAKAREHGVREVTLQSTLTAHEFYQRLGFVDTGPMAAVEIGGFPVRYFPMAIGIE